MCNATLEICLYLLRPGIAVRSIFRQPWKRDACCKIRLKYSTFWYPDLRYITENSCIAFLSIVQAFHPHNIFRGCLECHSWFSWYIWIWKVWVSTDRGKLSFETHERTGNACIVCMGYNSWSHGCYASLHSCWFRIRRILPTWGSILLTYERLPTRMQVSDSDDMSENWYQYRLWRFSVLCRCDHAHAKGMAALDGEDLLSCQTWMVLHKCQLLIDVKIIVGRCSPHQTMWSISRGDHGQ